MITEAGGRVAWCRQFLTGSTAAGGPAGPPEDNAGPVGYGGPMEPMDPRPPPGLGPDPRCPRRTGASWWPQAARILERSGRLWATSRGPPVGPDRKHPEDRGPAPHQRRTLQPGD